MTLQIMTPFFTKECCNYRTTHNNALISHEEGNLGEMQARTFWISIGGIQTTGPQITNYIPGPDQ